MLERLLPDSAAVAVARGDEPATELFPEERVAVARAVAKRRREFATGRACARRSLALLGVPPVAIPAGPAGAPRWPPGFAGSITHCEGYRACAVARLAVLAAIGIDAEPAAPLPAGVLEAIALPAERQQLAMLSARAPGTAWDRLMFCAKEAVYKAWSPLAGVTPGAALGFEDAEVEIDPGGRFTAQLSVRGPLLAGREVTSFAGRWGAEGGLLVTAIAVPAPAPPGRAAGF